MEIVQTPHSRILTVPVYGASADIAIGSMLTPGVTAETDLGVAIANSATSNIDALGVLRELHDYSESGDALVAGASYWGAQFNSAKTQKPMRAISLIDTATLAEVDYDYASKIAGITYTAGTATVAIGSLENNIDTSFLYVVSGTGLGQLGFVKTSSAASCTVTSAFTTALDATSYIIKILRLFHTLIVWTAPDTTSGTEIGTTAAAGSGRGMILDRFIIKNSERYQLDPLMHHNMQSLDTLANLRFTSLVAISDTVFHVLS